GRVERGGILDSEAAILVGRVICRHETSFLDNEDGIAGGDVNEILRRIAGDSAQRREYGLVRRFDVGGECAAQRQLVDHLTFTAGYVNRAADGVFVHPQRFSTDRFLPGREAAKSKFLNLSA